MYKLSVLVMTCIFAGCALDANRNIPDNLRTQECIRMLRTLENTTVYRKVDNDNHFRFLIQECERSIR